MDCQRRCEALKEKCEGYTYSSIGGQCELFASLNAADAIIKYADGSGGVVFRGAFSGSRHELNE